MKINQVGHLLSSAAFIGMIAAGGAALAQQAARPLAPRPAGAAPVSRAAPAAPVAALTPGPAIPSVCVFSQQGAIASSAVGKYAIQRLQQLSAQANAEVGGDKSAIETDAKALEAQKASIEADVYQQRALAINQRVQSLQRKAEQRGHELDATQQKAFGRIATELTPELRQVYSQRSCGLLLDGQAVMFANPANDVTGDVVKLLDARLTQFPFDREHLDQQQQAAPAAGQ